MKPLSSRVRMSLDILNWSYNVQQKERNTNLLQLFERYMNLQWSHLVFNQLSLLKMKSKKNGHIWAFQTREAKFTSVHLTVLLTNKRKILNVLSFNSKNAPPKIFSPHCLQNQNQINDCRRDKTLKKGNRAPPVGTRVEFRQLVHFKIECEWFFVLFFSSLCSQSQSRYPVLH